MTNEIKAQQCVVVLPARASTLTGNELDTQLAEAYNDALDEVTRLNQPASGGDPEKCSYQDDPRSPAELSLAGCNCVRFGEGNPHWPCKLHTPVSAGVVDERAAFETWHNQAYGPQDKYNPIRSLAYDSAGVGLGYDDTTVMAQFHAFKGALALSAPSHGEQVRDGWAVSLMGPDEVVRIQRKDGKWCGVTHLSESPRDRLLYEFLRTIAAPSSGSQGGDV